MKLDKTVWIIKMPRWFYPENQMKVVAFDLGLSIKIDIDKRLLRKELYIEIEGPEKDVKIFDDTLQAYIDANHIG